MDQGRPVHQQPQEPTPQPSDDEIVQSLIGTETKDELPRNVVTLVQDLVGGDEFSNPAKDSENRKRGS